VSTGGTAAANVSVSTIGSSYDTTLSVWTGTPGSLTNVACNDDILSGSITQSSLTFAATPGTNYFIMVAPFGYPNSPAQEAGGKTVLNVTGATLATVPDLTATPTSRTVAAGASATYMIANASTTVTYTLTCSGVPTGASCPMSAITVGPGMSASLMISTTSRLAGVPPSPTGRHFHINLWPNALMVIGAALGMFAARKRKAVGLVPLRALALLLVFVVAGCGSGSSGPATNPNGTPVGTYTITITGSSTQSTIVTLNVT